MYDSYYAMTSSKRNGTTIEEEMKKRGYVKDYYIGSGAYHWKKENQKGWWFVTHDHNNSPYTKNIPSIVYIYIETHK